MRAAAILLFSAAILASCADSSDDEAEQAQLESSSADEAAATSVRDDSANMAVATETEGEFQDDGEIAVEAETVSREDFLPLQPIRGGMDFALLGTTLGSCTFLVMDATPLLIAGAPDDDAARGKGVIRMNDEPVVLTAEAVGGPAYIEAGAVLAGGNISVEIDRAAGDGERIGIESRRWPATLILRREGAPETSFEGRYSCGV